MKFLNGIGCAIITPFLNTGEIDFDSLNKIIEFNISNGVDYLVVLGTTSEAATLNKQEKIDVVSHIAKFVNKRIPLVLGLGNNNTNDLVRDLDTFELNHFKAILSVAPYYNKPSQDGLYQHFRTLSLNAKLPIILYNVPSRTGVNISVKTTLKLANDFENIVAIKEASPNFLQTLDLIKGKNDSFKIISGDDELGLSAILAGSSGIISVLGQALPKQMSQMVHLGLNKECDRSFSIFYNLQNLMKLIFLEGNPSGIKTLMSILGLCQPTTRLPLVEASKELKLKIDQELKKILN